MNSNLEKVIEGMRKAKHEYGPWVPFKSPNTIQALVWNLDEDYQEVADGVEFVMFLPER